MFKIRVNTTGKYNLNRKNAFVVMSNIRGLHSKTRKLINCQYFFVSKELHNSRKHEKYILKQKHDSFQILIYREKARIMFFTNLIIV